MRLHCRDPAIGFQSVWELLGDRRHRLSELRHVRFRACWSAHKPHRLSPLGWFSPLETSATWAPNLDLHKQRKVKSTTSLCSALLQWQKLKSLPRRPIVWNIQTLSSFPGKLSGICSPSLAVSRNQIVRLTRTLSKVIGMICGFPPRLAL